ncbi:MAG: SDR family oxidoreductase [Aestuariivita sp.]|nr:SDR family oxidoreductase [Aestuariivita sp.]
MYNLENQKALVTAAGQGIGRAAAHALNEAGADVLATDINDDALAKLSKTGIDTAHLDVCDRTEIDSLMQKNAPFQILFNCAGYVHSGTLLEMTHDELNSALRLNVVAMADMARAVLPAMIAAGGGAIINMASVASSIKGVPDRAAYSISKAAVLGLTKSIAADYVKQGIRCNAICPGTVDSPSLQDRIRAGGDYDYARSMFIARQPMNRIGTPTEIADLVVYLAGAGFTTGQAYVIDGGWAI